MNLFQDQELLGTIAYDNDNGPKPVFADMRVMITQNRDLSWTMDNDIVVGFPSSSLRNSTHGVVQDTHIRKPAFFHKDESRPI